MNYYNSTKNQMIEAEKRNTNVLQILAEIRNATIVFRLPLWMKEQIRVSGKSDANFIIAKLAESMYKPIEIDVESWQKEVEEWK